MLTFGMGGNLGSSKVVDIKWALKNKKIKFKVTKKKLKFDVNVKNSSIGCTP